MSLPDIDPRFAAAEGDLLTAVADGVLRVTLNRPEAQNALTPDQRNALIDVLAAASADLAVRVVVLGAVGKGFCTGADLRAPAPPLPAARPADAPERAIGDVARTIRTGAQRLVTAVLDCEKPVIAAVQGTAAGIGAHLALACDLVVAAEGVRFIEVFVRRGIAPDGGGVWLLPRLVGLQRAKELLFLGDDVVASEAYRMGLVNAVVAPEALEAEVDRLAQRLAGAPTRALAMTKALLNRSFETDRGAMLESEALVQDLVMQTTDANEGVAAFRERRDTSYKGW